MDDTNDGIVILKRFVHPRNALSPMYVIDDGISICFNDLQSLNADSRIICIKNGIVIVSNSSFSIWSFISLQTSSGFSKIQRRLSSSAKNVSIVCCCFSSIWLSSLIFSSYLSIFDSNSIFRLLIAWSCDSLISNSFCFCESTNFWCDSWICFIKVHLWVCVLYNRKCCIMMQLSFDTYH